MDQWRSKFSKSFSLDRYWSIECSSLHVSLPLVCLPLVCLLVPLFELARRKRPRLSFSVFATEGGGLKVNSIPVEQIYRRSVCGAKAPCAWMAQRCVRLEAQVAVPVACFSSRNRDGAHEANSFGHVDPLIIAL